MATKQKEEVTLITVKNVFFYYASIAKPALLKEARDKGIQFDPNDPHANTEWIVRVAMPEKTFKALKKKYKGCTNFPHAKDYDLEEFKSVFHEDSDMPDFGDAEDLVVVKFAQKCRTKSGSNLTRPTVVGIVGRVQDSNGVPVDADVIIGNGSKGHIQLRPVDFGDNGIYLYPNAICISELVEYVPVASSEVDMDAFGIEELPVGELDDKEDDDNDDFDNDIGF